MIYVTGEVYGKQDATRKFENLFKQHNMSIPYNDISEWLGDQLHRYDLNEVADDHDSAALFLNYYYDEEQSTLYDLDMYLWEYSTAYYDHETHEFSAEYFHDTLEEAMKSYKELDNAAWGKVL